MTLLSSLNSLAAALQDVITKSAQVQTALTNLVTFLAASI